MALIRVDNQTGTIVGPISAGTASFQLTLPWAGATIGGADYTRMVIDPPVLGVINIFFEAIYCTVINGSTTVTVTQRGAEGSTAQAHAAGAFWVCAPSAEDLTGLVASVTAGTNVSVTGTASAPVINATVTGAQLGVANTFTQPQTLPVIDKGGQVFNAKAYGVKGDGSTDDTATIQALIALVQGTVTNGVPGGSIFFPPGEYVISSTLNLTRFAGVISGAGVGQSPSYSTPGQGSVIRWAGNNSTPMIEVVDSLFTIFRDLRLEGNNANPPTYGIQFNNAGGSHGGNHRCSVSDVWIGQFPWSSQGTNQGNVASCIGYTGTDGNNDQFHFDRVTFSYPTAYGLYLPNTQSIWGLLTSPYFDHCGTAGVGTNSDITMLNATFNACAIDLHTGIAGAPTDGPNVMVFGWYSENTGQMADLPTNGKLKVYGGAIQTGAVQSGGKVLINAFPSNNQTIHLDGVTFTQLTTAANCTIQFGPTSSGGYVGKIFVKITRCRGIQPAQLVLAGSMWATVPLSIAIVEWDSMDGVDWSGTKNAYEFRNELAATGTGTRTTLNTGVWDVPVAGARG
jgi:hypothetical protein